MPRRSVDGRRAKISPLCHCHGESAATAKPRDRQTERNSRDTKRPSAVNRNPPANLLTINITRTCRLHSAGQVACCRRHALTELKSYTIIISMTMRMRMMMMMTMMLAGVINFTHFIHHSFHRHRRRGKVGGVGRGGEGEARAGGHPQYKIR